MVAAKYLIPANRTKAELLHEYLAADGPGKEILSVPRRKVDLRAG